MTMFMNRKIASSIPATRSWSRNNSGDAFDCADWCYMHYGVITSVKEVWCWVCWRLLILILLHTLMSNTHFTAFLFLTVVHCSHYSTMEPGFPLIISLQLLPMCHIILQRTNPDLEEKWKSISHSFCLNDNILYCPTITFYQMCNFGHKPLQLQFNTLFDNNSPLGIVSHVTCGFCTEWMH